MILIYVICKNKTEAEKIAKMLLKLRLIACANWRQVESCYRWKNKIVNGHETVMILKTRQNYFKRVEGIIKKIHSYEIPCIIKLNPDKVSGNYQKWLLKETKIV
ncbi:MAG TPA: divalent-cation tolerance protein CutA [Patescibacteria group bacterium]|nr:divalent-cation tolerance protein CutA [Patescibacteria group bacterium]